HEKGAGADHDQAQPSGPQQLHIVRIDLDHVERDQERQGYEDPDREPALRGENPDLPANGLALPDSVRQAIQDLREVSAHLTLDVDSEHGPLELLTAHPVCRGADRLVERTTQLDLRHHSSELRPGGLAYLLRHGVEGLKEA